MTEAQEVGSKPLLPFIQPEASAVPDAGLLTFLENQCRTKFYRRKIRAGEWNQ